MSDIIDNDTEEETSGFGLGRGLDALFGDDEVMGLDDDEPTATAENDLPTEKEGLGMAALMAEESPAENDTTSAEEIDMAALMAEEQPKEETAQPESNDAPVEEAETQDAEPVSTSDANADDDDNLIVEIESIIETMEVEKTEISITAAEDDTVIEAASEEAPEEEMDMAALMAAEEPVETTEAASEEEMDMAALMAQEQPKETKEEQPLPERKTLSDAADSLVSALERHIEESEATPNSGRSRQSLPIENLYPSPFQPRKVFRQESIDELASSIRQYGVLQPLLVRKDPKNEDGYEIIAGERRWRASQQAQIHELPVVVLEIDELEAYKIALIENLQREDIDPIDEAFGYQKLLEDFGQTQEQLADAVGKSRPHITNTLRLLQLPPLAQAMVSERELSMGHARALIGVENAEEIAQKVHKQGLSVRQTEKLAAAAKGKIQQKRPRGASPANTSKPAKDADTIALENDISNALGMNVNIDSVDGKSGKLSVEFKSLDQLDELLHRLAHFPGTRLSG